MRTGPMSSIVFRSLVCWLVAGCAAQTAAVHPAAAPAAAPASAPPPVATAGEPPEDAPGAVRFFEARVAIAADDVESWQRLAISLRRVNRLQEAARAAWRAIELAPTWESWTALGNVLMQGRARAGTLAAFAVAATKAPDPDAAARNFLNLGYREWSFGNTKAAADAIDLAEKLSPANPQVFYDRANLLAATGFPVEATAAAKRSLALLAPVDAEKLPTEEARNGINVMRALLQRIVDGHELPERPTVDEATQELPARFSENNKGNARALAIDPVSYRIYPIGKGQLFRVAVPTSWNETFQASAESTDVRLAPAGDAPRAVLQITALLSQVATVDLRGATDKGAEAVRGGGGVVELVQPVGKGAYWFWSTDPRAKPDNPKDYPFLAQSFSQEGGVVLSATYLTREASAGERAVLPKLVESAGTARIGK